MFLQNDPLQVCVLNLELLQTHSEVVRMGGESVGSCPPNVFSLPDRANISKASSELSSEAQAVHVYAFI